MDFAKIFARIKAILTKPKTEWPVIAAEPSTIKGLYTGYLVVVVALPAIAQFIRFSLVGFGTPTAMVRVPIGAGIAQMVLIYLLTLLLVYLVTLVVNALAPSFGGQKDTVQAAKAIAYAWTSFWIGGIAVIVPWIGRLIMLAGLVYGVYLMYLGLPRTMKCPAEKSAGYTAACVIVAIVLGLVFFLIASAIVGATSFLQSSHLAPWG